MGLMIEVFRYGIIKNNIYAIIAGSAAFGVCTPFVIIAIFSRPYKNKKRKNRFNKY